VIVEAHLARAEVAPVLIAQAASHRPVARDPINIEDEEGHWPLPSADGRAEALAGQRLA
jgi:hypothetical protein